MASPLWMGVMAVVAAYLLGSIPTGLVLVRLSTGKDLRHEHSGRTGGTNAARAAGAWAGIGTMIGDGLKAAGAVWLAHALTAGQPLIEAIAGVMAVLGHNYSLFMIERREGKLRFRGGAGGAPTVGAAIGLWGPSALFMIPTGIGVLLLIGYASVATISVGVAATVVFLVRGWRRAADPGATSSSARWSSCCCCWRCGPIWRACAREPSVSSGCVPGGRGGPRHGPARPAGRPSLRLPDPGLIVSELNGIGVPAARSGGVRLARLQARSRMASSASAPTAPVSISRILPRLRCR